jgi:ankyrin repeat protein
MLSLCRISGLVSLVSLWAGGQVQGVTPLMRAAEEGQLTLVKRLLKQKKPAVNVRDGSGSTALMLAVAGRDTPTDAEGDVANRKDRPKERLGIVELLLKSGARADLGANEGCATQSSTKNVTPLMRAIEVGRIDMVRAMVKFQARPPLNLEARNSDGLSALHYAARQPTGEVVRLLIVAGAKVNGRVSGGTTALMSAASADSFGAVGELLRSGADPNAATLEGDTALHFSTGSKIARALLSRGARMTLNRAGISAYTLALWRGDTELVRLLKGLNPPTAYFDAVLESDLPAVKDWISRGASPNAKFVNNAPILHAAVRTSSPEVVRALLGAGAKVGAKGAFAERTAIIEALVEGFDEPKTAEEELRRLGVVTALIEGGASVIERDTRTGYSPVMFAAKRNSLSLVKLLMDKGAIVEKQDLENLNLLATNISPDILKLLKSGRK